MLENIQAEALISKFREEMALWEEHLKSVKAEERDIYKIRSLAQDACTHPYTKEQESFNYHTRDEWTDVICKVCDKHLRTY